MLDHGRSMATRAIGSCLPILRAPNPNALMFVAGDFSREPYGLVVRRDDPDFRLAVNRALVGLYAPVTSTRSSSTGLAPWASRNVAPCDVLPKHAAEADDTS